MEALQRNTDVYISSPTLQWGVTTLSVELGSFLNPASADGMQAEKLLTIPGFI
jgi:hypothetical protein